MNYAQALAYINQKYGSQPWNSVSGLALLQELRAAGVSNAVSSDINLAYYTAKRTNSTIDSVLQSKGLTTPAAPTTATPPVTTTTPTNVGTIAPSALAAGESGAIGAASIASQTAALPTPSLTNPLATTTTTDTTGAPKSNYTPDQLQAIIRKLQSGGTAALTDAELVAIGIAPRTPAPTTTTTTTPAGTPAAGTVSFTLNDGTAVTVPSSIVSGGNTFTYDGTNWVRKNAAGQTETLYKSDLAGYLTPVGGFKLTNGVLDRVTAPAAPTAENTVEGGGTLQNPLATTPGTTTTTPSAVGPAGDSIANLEYQNRLIAAGSLEGRAKEAYNLAVRLAGTEQETAVRQAEANAYNAALRSVAGLGARGITGAGGLSIAAQRAARSEPLQKRMAAIQQYLGKTSAASLLLADENAKAKQAREDAEVAMLRANKIASDLAAGATGVPTSTATTQQGSIGNLTNPLSLSQNTQQSLNTLPPVLQVPRM